MRAIFMILLAGYLWNCAKSISLPKDNEAFGHFIKGLFMFASWCGAAVGIALMIMGV